ncbi:MAG: penicillin-binding protein 2 [Micromonosporaceae bacterium]|nr:penicillin-binding protein 2 [Micromonosporaceae bacterium]
MNAPLRRVGVVVLILFALLFINLNWVQGYKANAYRNDPHNGRVLLSEYQRERGRILLAGGEVAAQSVATTDNLKYQRRYPLGAAYAQVVGYKPVTGAATGIERAENDFLAGTADSLFTERVKDLFTGNRTPGGNVLLTIDKKVQDAAYNGLLTNQKGVTSGAAVALDPKTGKILALTSIPSFDPNPLVSHDTTAAGAAYTRANSAAGNPLLLKATGDVYPPASTMKVIISAAALSSGQYTPQTPIPATNSYSPIPGSGHPITNSSPNTCPQPTLTLLEALTVSCNTAFARLGVTLGADQVTSMAQAFGFEDGGLTITGTDNQSMPVAASHTGDLSDKNFLAQSSIGQYNVRESPMQNALIAATIANGGVQMRPYLVDKLQAPDLNIISTTQPKTLRTPIQPQVAAQLQDMMVSVVQNGTGQNAQIPGYRVGGKTGTAQNGEGADAHGWFIGWAMKDNQPIVAVCVFLQQAGPGGSAEAARIGGNIMQAAISEKGPN